ncbi:MAG: UDP-N-acetylmuramate--L-alanine ligase [Planctomycetota bacterium]
MPSPAPSRTMGAPRWPDDVLADTIDSLDVSAAQAAQQVASHTSRFASQRVHFVGIGGVGMSGLAHILADAGATVTGSDPSPSDITEGLTRRGIHVSGVQDGGLLSKDVDLVVRTAAVADDNAELLAANHHGLETIYYAELLGQIMAERCGIAVAGTHGKSTTTAMLAYALTRCGLDPSFVVGGTVPQLGGGSSSGTGDTFVAEACEYNRSFLNLAPTVAVITNIEADHLDTYPGGLNEIIATFAEFAAKLPPAARGGRLVVSGDDTNVHRLVEENQDDPGKVWRVGKSLGCEWTIVSGGHQNGLPVGHLLHEGKQVAQLKLKVPGAYNLQNAAMAVVAAAAVGADVKQAAEAVSSFRGVDRRQTVVGQVKGSIEGVTVVDDYAHHPTEIRMTLAAVREQFQPGRVICVFQPHQASRTRHLLDDFATSFAAADLVFLPDIYSVRDTPDDQRFVSSGTLAEHVRSAGGHAEHVKSFEKVADRVRGELQAGDLVVTMGAGDVWKVGQLLVGA